MESCIKCNSTNLMFMDNSFALGAGMWCHPYFYCNDCSSVFYDDGCGAIEDSMTKSDKAYLVKCMTLFNDKQEFIKKEYQRFTTNKFIYNISKKEWIEWVNDLFGFDYVGLQPKTWA